MKFTCAPPSFRLFIFASLLVLFCVPSSHAEHVKGILFPDAIIVDKTRLHINGTAIRSKWGFNVYVVRLYLIEKNKDADAIMLNRDPKRIHITMLRGVSKKRFVSTIETNIEVNFSSEEKQKFATNLKSFMACFHGGTSLNRFNTIDIDFIPGKGMEVSVDGKLVDTIPDDDFYHAIMRLWIGNPPQPSLKTGLTGTD